MTVNGLLAVAFTGLMVAAGWVAGASPTLGPAADLAYRMGALGVILNLILAIFNLVPLPPLDGSHVVAQLLPPSARPRYRAMGRYGIGILMLAVFVAPEALSVLLWPAFALTDLAFAVVEWLV
ncbi:MAG: hypothetical protein GWM90_10350 [Gemmatimonadetes bacterium]|nr:hypothetical protein [Gemmatimonadota bacterium]NIQ54354.1 hypothetical protein [Gemmatimonadota bacterium]NIX44503.1 hypothetical protein [Gemmatimonadota bacterium]